MDLSSCLVASVSTCINDTANLEIGGISSSTNGEISTLLNNKIVIAYFTAWSIYGRSYFVSDIPFDRLTHINYAFANIHPNEPVIVLGDPYADIDKFFPGDTWDETIQPLRGNFWQLNTVYKARYPHLKTFISIGGWTWSRRFSDIALTVESRAQFAKSCREFIDAYQFDGVDVDWEYPVEGGLGSNVYRPEDGTNYVLLLKAIRQEIGPDKLLTIAAPAGPDKMRHIYASDMAPVLDWMNIMTYDFKGAWSSTTGHQANLYGNEQDADSLILNVQAAVEYYIENGMPADKLVIGGAIYGRSWANVPPENNGLFQSFTGTPQGSWDSSGVFDYKDIVAFSDDREKFSRFWDDKAQAPWLYSNSERITISYDDVQSIVDKSRYIISRGLLGIMYWELSGDDADPGKSLLEASFIQLQKQPVTTTRTIATSTTTSTSSTSTQTRPSSTVQTDPTNSCPRVTVTATQTNCPISASTVTRTSYSTVQPSVTNTQIASNTRTLTATRTFITTSTITPSSSYSSGSPAPTNRVCVGRAEQCNYGRDTFACSGENVAVCDTTGKWVILECASGTRCQYMSGGNVVCQWKNQIQGTTC